MLIKPVLVILMKMQYFGDIVTTDYIKSAVLLNVRRKNIKAKPAAINRKVKTSFKKELLYLVGRLNGVKKDP